MSRTRPAPQAVRYTVNPTRFSDMLSNRAEFMAAAIERARLARRITSLPIVVQGDQP